MLDLNAELAALQARPEPAAGVPAAPAPATPAPSNPAPISNANAPIHIGAAPPSGTPAPAAGVPAPAAGAPPAPLTYEQLEERHNNLRAAVADVRSTNRTLQRELDTERADRVRMQQNFQTLMARVAGGQAQPTPAPAPVMGARPSPNGALQAIDPNAIAADPLAALQQLALFANGLLAEREQQGQVMMQRQQMTAAQQQQQAQEAQAMQRVALALSDSEAEFREMVAPDYDHAAEHYVNVRLAILQANGYPVEQAANAVQWELLQSANVAISQGLNPARAIYEAARTMGYNGPRAPQPAPAPAPYAPPAPISYAPAQPAPVDPLAHIRAGQAAAQSVSNATGGGIPGEVDLAAGLALTGAAFDAWSKKFERKMRGLE